MKNCGYGLPFEECIKRISMNRVSLKHEEGISFDDALKFLKEEFNNINWASVNIKEDPTQLTQLYGIKQVPSMVVISKDGTTKTYTGRDVATYYRLVRSIT